MARSDYCMARSKRKMPRFVVRQTVATTKSPIVFLIVPIGFLKGPIRFLNAPIDFLNGPLEFFKGQFALSGIRSFILKDKSIVYLSR